MDWSPMKFRQNMREMRLREMELAEQNPFLAQALETEKMEGHRIAVIARTVAMLIIACMLPFLNPNIHVLYYEAIIFLFILLGWLQYRYANVGYSKRELLLIFLDLVLLTVIFVVPNPFLKEEYPTVLLYRFDNFIYFFVILAIAMLAFSWRTVWSMGLWVAIVWTLGLVGVLLFGKEIPELDQQAENAFAGFELVTEMLAPGSANIGNRVQEIVVFILVAGILAIKGYRTNLLIMKQADISAERANLSRYFPSSMVDALASSKHDIGAVRSQDVAVLFTDIVGFTKYAERNDAEDVMSLLRDYHALVERAIFEHEGTLEKYIGDGVMATFGRPEQSPGDATNALLCAQQIIASNTEFNRKREVEGKEPVTISIGIHYGTVILGDIGPERRLEFAVVGDTVNVASRLEAESRKIGCKCVVSDDVIKNVDQSVLDKETALAPFHLHGDVQLRGRNQPISVWVA